MKRKICIVISARPSYARVKSVLSEIKKNKNLELILILTASTLLDRYGNLIDIVKKDGFKVNYKVHMLIEGGNLVTSAKSTGLSIIELSTLFDRLNPDIVLTIADRYETIATAISAAYTNIPVGHIQGGEITGSIDEKVRHAVTKLSDLHFVSNKLAAKRLEKMGENPKNVFVTGCPSIDLARDVEKYKKNVKKVYIEKGVGYSVDLNDNYLVVMQNPVTYEWKNTANQIKATLNAIKKIDMQVFWFWPNVDAGVDNASKAIRIFRENNSKLKIKFLKNMPPEDFLALINKSLCLIGNSSVGIRECSYLGVPFVNIGSRQSGRDRGKNVIDCDYNSLKIEKAIKFQIKHGKYKTNKLYGNGNSGRRIANILKYCKLTTIKKSLL